MCAYFSKAEDATSEAMKKAAELAISISQTKREYMKTVARAYLTKRECSIQEAVYHAMPQLWLSKSSPAVIFANSNLPENQHQVFLSQEEVEALPPESINIYKTSMIDRYIDRPNSSFMSGRYKVFDKMCFN